MSQVKTVSIDSRKTGWVTGNGLNVEVTAHICREMMVHGDNLIAMRKPLTIRLSTTIDGKADCSHTNMDTVNPPQGIIIGKIGTKIGLKEETKAMVDAIIAELQATPVWQEQEAARAAAIAEEMEYVAAQKRYDLINGV